MKIGGLLKFSTLDYPGKISAVIFCQGCPMRCGYCHNSDLLDFNLPGSEDFDDVLKFLESRKALLDAAVFSGGDPLLQPDLKESILKVKNLGFLIGLHTSGTIPEAFSKILPIVDWVGFDMKTSFENYEKVTNIPKSGELAKNSFYKLVKSNVNFEIRTTFDPRFILENDLYTVAKILAENNVEEWILQECILRNPLGDEKLLLPNEDILANISKYITIKLRKQ